MAPKDSSQGSFTYVNWWWQLGIDSWAVPKFPKFRIRGKRFRTVNDSNDCTIYWYGGCSTIFKTIVRTWDVAKCKAAQPRRTAAVGCGPALVHIVLPYGLWICRLSWWSGNVDLMSYTIPKNHHDLCIGLKPSSNDRFMGCQHYIKIHLCLNMTDSIIELPFERRGQWWLINLILFRVLHFLKANIFIVQVNSQYSTCFRKSKLLWTCGYSNNYLGILL